jgi:hypothetical protein
MTTIKLNKTNPPYYVNQFGAPIENGGTVKWEAENGKFTITIRDAYDFYDVDEYKKIFTINSADPTPSQTLTVRTGLALNTQKPYEVFCIDLEDTSDVPPRIIITPAA